MLLLFAPGAGLPSSSPWMEGWATRLGALGRVVRFDYPYARAGRRRPDRLPVLIEAHREALEAHRRPDEPVVLVGKSMGSRIGCHVATEVPVHGVVCLGYPLFGVDGSVRDGVLVGVERPILFVQGTRDRLCPLDALDAVRARMRAPNAVHVVPTGDHDLRITRAHARASGRDQEDEDRAISAAIEAFTAGCAAGPGPAPPA